MTSGLSKTLVERSMLYMRVWDDMYARSLTGRYGQFDFFQCRIDAEGGNERAKEIMKLHEVEYVKARLKS